MVDRKENYKFDRVVKGLTIFLLFYRIKTSRFYVTMIEHRRCHYAISIHLYQ